MADEDVKEETGRGRCCEAGPSGAKTLTIPAPSILYNFML